MTAEQRASKPTSIDRTGLPLREVLRCRGLTSLQRLARRCKLRGTSRLRKDLLLDALVDSLLSSDGMEELLYLTESAPWAAFRNGVADGRVSSRQLNRGAFYFLEDLGYVYPLERGTDAVYGIPADVRRACLALLDSGFQARKARADLIHAYALSAVNLYGIMAIHNFLHVFNRQNAHELDMEELQPILERNIAADRGYMIWERYLVSDAFADNSFRDVPDLMAEIGDKPRYLPPKEEFLRYVDENYYERTRQTDQMQNFLRLECGMDVLTTQNLMLQLHFGAVLDAEVGELLGLMNEHGISLDEDSLPVFLGLLSDMYQHTRRWADNGHTPEELERKRRPRETPAIPTRLRVGRNDPCPCGSGKKYKRCCGR